MNIFTKITISIILLIMAKIMAKPVLAAGFKFTTEICKKYGLGKNWYCESDKKEDAIKAEDILNSNLPGEEKARLLEGLRDLHTKRAVIDGKQCASGKNV